ncbi:WAT1-related protein At5g40240-like isoform X2 [Impatiens glandulifera]|uniref:WAT1-related protein At5g40240-like isoform X2 n=1 Tax=Impatiens glandulifera TaxID=253017 RepID=UPI001FB057E8|nr:WAT1-related protein At5g40240-like isoform X2 [Impatiens glandulifera]
MLVSAPLSISSTTIHSASFFFFHSSSTASTGFLNKQSDLTFALLFRFFLLGLFGRSLLLFGYTGIRYSSPALAAAINNLVPVFTFLLAIIFKIEKMDLKNVSSVAKFLGTIVAVSGALVDTLYKGPPIISGTSQSALDPQALAADDSKWALGGLLLGISAFSIATWNILQAATVKLYPEKISVVFFFSLFGTLQCAIIAFIVEKDPIAWIIPPGIPTVAIIYAGTFGIAIRFNIITWCLHEKGPLFVTMFKPLGMVIAVISGMVLLGDALYLGSVIGAGIIAVGFYMVMWGQGKESKVTPSLTKERKSLWKKLSQRWNRKAQL